MAQSPASGGSDDISIALIEMDPAGPRLSWAFPSLANAAHDSIGVLAARAQLLCEELPEPLTASFFCW